MNKLFKLKEWHTLADAAMRLSYVFEEKVTEADILRFALDGLLKLSVYFVNHTYAKKGTYVEWEETEWKILPSLSRVPVTAVPKEEIEEPPGTVFRKPPKQLAELIAAVPESELKNIFLTSLNVGDGRFVRLEENVESISGVWDLTMFGGERLDIEHKYQSLIGGPAVTLETLDGSFVENDGEVCQLQESFDDNRYTAGSMAALEDIKTAVRMGKIDELAADELFDAHKAARKVYLERRRKNPKDDYYPAGGLPRDHVLVVRTNELLRFEQSLNKDYSVTNKPESSRKTDNLLRAIAGIAIHAYGYNPQSSKSSAPTEIAEALSDLGHPLDPKTIRGWLNEGCQLLPSKTLEK